VKGNKQRALEDGIHVGTRKDSYFCVEKARKMRINARGLNEGLEKGRKRVVKMLTLRKKKKTRGAEEELERQGRGSVCQCIACKLLKL